MVRVNVGYKNVLYNMPKSWSVWKMNDRLLDSDDFKQNVDKLLKNLVRRKMDGVRKRNYSSLN